MLQINTKKFMNDLIKQLNKEMDRVAELLVQFMIFEIDSIPESGNINAVGKPEWRREVIDALKFRSKAESMAIVKEIGILDQQNENLLWKSLLVEFGMGTTADTGGNPWIQEYLNSGYYDSSRGGMQVFTKPGQSVYDPDSDTWGESGAKSRYEIPQFRQVGSHFWSSIFGNSSILAKKYFDDAIDKAINSIDISKYVEMK